MKSVFVCVYRKGAGFTDEYPLRLYEGLMERTPNVPEFICLTSEQFDAPFHLEPLIYHLQGWWNKIELFRAGLFTEYDRVFFMDLDALIVGDLTPLLSYNGEPMLMNRGFRSGLPSSSIMSWKPGQHPHILPDFLSRKIYIMGRHKPGGDQEYIRTHLNGRWTAAQDVQPGIYSYKNDLRGKEIPADSTIHMFHGPPRPHEIGWII